jgi:hypothetical protein
MTRTIIVIAAGLVFAATLPVISADAAARDRVFVASYGSDSNPCTFGSPCKTFSQAVSVVAAGGEVTAIDSAGFGPVTITQSVTITSPNGVEAGIVAASGGNAVTINAISAATITLRGLTLEGSGVDDHGIYLTSAGGGALNIIDTVVKDFTNSGIAIQPAGGQINVFISNSYSLNNGQDGIKIAATGGGGGTGVSYEIDHSTVSGNSANGFDFEEASGNFVTGGLTESVAGLNSNVGIYLSETGAQIYNCKIIQNGSFGLSVNNNGIATLSGTSFVNGNVDISTDNSGALVNSFGNNAYSFYNGNIVQKSLR